MESGRQRTLDTVRQYQVVCLVVGDDEYSVLFHFCFLNIHLVCIDCYARNLLVVITRSCRVYEAQCLFFYIT